MAKKIGILGGMSPESTVEYYLYITRKYAERYGDHGYPEVIIYSMSLQPYIDWPTSGRWDLVAQGLGQAAQKLQAAGADFIVIATNTMHKVVEEVRAQVGIPIISLLDVVADAIEKQGIAKVGLLGTAFTMNSQFYPQTLARRNITVLVPDDEGKKYVHRVVYSELVTGKILPESRQGFLNIISDLEKQGAQGVILGCTEIPLLVKQSDTALPLFDTTSLHAEAALQFALRP